MKERRVCERETERNRLAGKVHFWVCLGGHGGMTSVLCIVTDLFLTDTGPICFPVTMNQEALLYYAFSL